MVWKVHACLCVCVCVCVCVCTRGWGATGSGTVYVWVNKKLSHTHISISVQDSWATMSVCSHQNPLRAAHETQRMCADTHTQTHTDTHTHSCHTRRRRWWACGRQIHLRSVPAQRVIRELPNQAKAHWSRPVLRPDSAAVPGWFFFFYWQWLSLRLVSTRQLVTWWVYLKCTRAYVRDSMWYVDFQTDLKGQYEENPKVDPKEKKRGCHFTTATNCNSNLLLFFFFYY